MAVPVKEAVKAEDSGSHQDPPERGTARENAAPVGAENAHSSAPSTTGSLPPSTMPAHSVEGGEACWPLAAPDGSTPLTSNAAASSGSQVCAAMLAATAPESCDNGTGRGAASLSSEAATTCTVAFSERLASSEAKGKGAPGEGVGVGVGLGLGVGEELVVGKPDSVASLLRAPLTVAEALSVSGGGPCVADALLRALVLADDCTEALDDALNVVLPLCSALAVAGAEAVPATPLRVDAADKVTAAELDGGEEADGVALAAAEALSGALGGAEPEAVGAAVEVAAAVPPAEGLCATESVACPVPADVELTEGEPLVVAVAGGGALLVAVGAAEDPALAETRPLAEATADALPTEVAEAEPDAVGGALPVTAPVKTAVPV